MSVAFRLPFVLGSAVVEAVWPTPLLPIRFLAENMLKSSSAAFAAWLIVDDEGPGTELAAAGGFEGDLASFKIRMVSAFRV